MIAPGQFPFASIICTMLLCGQWDCYGRTETYTLVGMREPVVTVKEGTKGFDVTARFLAVDAFDSLTNQKLNRQKGQGFASIALARFMGIDKTQSMTVSGLKPTDMRLRDRSIEVSFSIEKVNQPTRFESQSPKLVGRKERNAGGASAERDVPESSARATDYLDTIALIDAGGRSSAADLLEGWADLYEGIASIEEETLGLFELVRRQVASDALLQQEERGRILADIARAQKDFLVALRVELQILEASAK